MDLHPDNRYTTAEKIQLGLELDLILSSEKTRKRRKSTKPQTNRALHQLWYEIVQTSKKGQGHRGYDIWKIIPWEDEESAA